MPLKMRHIYFNALVGSYAEIQQHGLLLAAQVENLRSNYIAPTSSTPSQARHHPHILVRRCAWGATQTSTPSSLRQAKAWTTRGAVLLSAP
jgi:hypothetical protein